MPRTRKQAADVRLGRQTPTAAVVLPYTKTLGQDAIDLYNTTGRTAQRASSRLTTREITLSTTMGLTVVSQLEFEVLLICQHPPSLSSQA